MKHRQAPVASQGDDGQGGKVLTQPPLNLIPLQCYTGGWRPPVHPLLTDMQAGHCMPRPLSGSRPSNKNFRRASALQWFFSQQLLPRTALGSLIGQEPQTNRSQREPLNCEYMYGGCRCRRVEQQDVTPSSQSKITPAARRANKKQTHETTKKGLGKSVETAGNQNTNINEMRMN